MCVSEWCHVGQDCSRHGVLSSTWCVLGACERAKRLHWLAWCVVVLIAVVLHACWALRFLGACSIILHVQPTAATVGTNEEAPAANKQVASTGAGLIDVTLLALMLA